MRGFVTDAAAGVCGLNRQVTPVFVRASIKQELGKDAPVTSSCVALP